MVQFAPVEKAIPYIRMFYNELKVDADPCITDVLCLDGCLWVECLIDGANCGGFILIRKPDGYEVMTLLVPPARGKAAVQLGREGVALFRRTHPGVRLLVTTYSHMRAAQLFITAVGFHRAKSVNEGDTRDGQPCNAIYYNG